MFKAVLRIRIRDPVPFWPRPWIRDPGWVKNEDPDPGWTSWIIFFESLETIFWVKKILKFFDADPDPGSEIFLTLDPGSMMEKFGSGINIPDTQRWFKDGFKMSYKSLCSIHKEYVSWRSCLFSSSFLHASWLYILFHYLLFVVFQVHISCKWSSLIGVWLRQAPVRFAHSSF